MATAADFVRNNHSPGSSGFSGDGLNSPQFRRNENNFSSPWAQVVRGDFDAVTTTPLSSPAAAPQDSVSPDDCFSAKVSTASSSSSSPDSFSVEAQPESSDNGDRNVAWARKGIWNKSSNGIVEVGPVMGAVSWPALSEAIRVSPRSSSDSLKSLSDGSVSASQNSMKHSGVGPVIAGVSQQPPPLLPLPVVEVPQNSSGKLGQAIPEPSLIDTLQMSSNCEIGPRGGFMPESQNGNDHPQQRNSWRRGSGSSHIRGDHRGRRDQARGNFEWNTRRSFNGREFHMQQYRVVQRPFTRLSPISTPFISPPHVPPFGNPMGFPDVTSPVYYVPALPPESPRGVPFVAHVPSSMIFFPGPESQLHTLLVNQVDYYFSNENLIRDTYLRQNMDEQGWVPISLIASFNRVRQLTTDIRIILDAVRMSTVVEVQGDKVRKRREWINWIFPSSNELPTVPGPQSPGRSYHDMLATHIQNVALEESTNHGRRGHTDIQTLTVSNRLSSGKLNSQSQPSDGEGKNQVLIHAGSDRSMSMRNRSKSNSW